MPKTENLLSKEEIASLGPIEWTPLWIHWNIFYETWKETGRSMRTVLNVWETLRFMVISWEMWTIESWEHTDYAFSKLHGLRKQRNWSPTTFNTYRKNANSYFICLVKRWILSKNPVGNIEKMREMQRNYAIPSTTDIKGLLSYLQTCKTVNNLEKKRNLLFVQLLIETGARPVELISLTIDSVQDRKSVRIDGAKIWWKPRSYPMSEVTKTALRDYLNEAVLQKRDTELEKALFIGIKKWRAWSYSWIRKLFNRLNSEMSFASHITPYSFRRNAATTLHRKWIKLESISKFLGHTRTATTMRYIQNLPEINEEASGILFKEYHDIDL